MNNTVVMDMVQVVTSNLYPSGSLIKNSEIRKRYLDTYLGMGPPSGISEWAVHVSVVHVVHNV